MHVKQVSIRNFRRLENIDIDFEESETIFVGANNSGKTSATVAFRSFLGSRGFSIHDISTAKLAEIDAFNPDTSESGIPEIQFDMWFAIDPDDIAFGQAYSLLPNISDDFTEVGIRYAYTVKDLGTLWADYVATCPTEKDGSSKSLSDFLGLEQNLKKYFELRYFSLERSDEDISATPLDPLEGRRLTKTLVRVDFIDAQRNIDEGEVGRGNKLSSAFAYFYEKNLEKAEAAEEALQVITDNNQRLTEHYAEHFGDLLTVIRGLGVPSAYDRDLKLVSSLSAETALKGSADLMYVDPTSEHELPEAYNGLGFKNLIFMAVQISHAHLQWMNTERNRPLCQIIFVEEPEVHLHAQVQQTFITNIWQLLNDAAEETDGPVPQLAVTTHSSHILEAADFSKIRYFRRCAFDCDEAGETRKLNATRIHSLRNFQPEAVQVEDEQIPPEEVLNFLKKYLKLTHCDLFFADAVVLVEGTVEKLLLPEMINRCAADLRLNYLTTLEVGGAYAHRFAGLLEFLNIPYLVITDIDSVDPANSRKACMANVAGAVTSNASLKSFFPHSTIQQFVSMDQADRAQQGGQRFVSFQLPISADHSGIEIEVHGRTLEETFVYENLTLIADDELSIDVDVPEEASEVFEKVYAQVKNTNFKKTEFALDVLSSSASWVVPRYISDGLQWLENKMNPNAEE